MSTKTEPSRMISAMTTPRVAALAPTDDGSVRIHRLLVASDGSEAAHYALRAAAAIALAHGADLEVLTVASPPLRTAGPFGHPITVVGDDPRVHARALAVAQVERDCAIALGVSASAAVLQGSTASAITGRAKRVGADLVVIGATGHGLVTGAALGSVSQAVIGASSVPVLVVRGKLEWPPGRTIVGFDGTPGACAAMKVAATLIRPSDSPIALMLGVDHPSRGGDVWAMRQANLERHGDRLRRSGLSHVVAMTSDLPPLDVLTLEYDPTATVVAVGRRGRSRLRGALVGSVSWNVLKWSHCSVLVVPPPPAIGASTRASHLELRPHEA